MRGRAAACLAALSLAHPALADDRVERGRALFHGTAGNGMQVQVGQRMMPAHGISCAGCHGGDAGGGAEVQSGPAIDWPSLTARGYSPAGLERALTTGATPDGTALGGAMPRFAFQDPQDVPALVAYLSVIAQDQRTGVTDAAITLGRPPPVATTAPFWDAFQDQLAALAPNGLFGRQIRLSTHDPALAMIGATRLPVDGAMPLLFPLVPLLGDEDPAYLRGGFASIAAQVQAVAAAHPGLHVVASPDMAARLAPLMAPHRVTFRTRFEALPKGRPAMILGADLLAHAPLKISYFATIDDVAHLPTAPRACLTATDPRPADMPRNSA
ncbi:MAG: c-type cytochrome, partial [Paracoccus sp. (in: a-proteobacteria)]|nr:c-type cytochrome [Paracoccus sp. (in: a-proteobacteria)]